MTEKPDRKTFIGGSDIAAVMGLSRWKTPLHLWAEKTGEIAETDLSDNEAVELGTELEEFVAKKFERKTGMKVRRAPTIYVHSDHDFLRCQVDRLVTGADSLLEVKTTSAWRLKDWEGDEIPQEYVLQVQWQLGITDRTIGWIAVLIGGQNFLYKQIQFDQELFDLMVKRALAFWEMVQTKTPPMAVAEDSDFILDIFPHNTDQVQELEEWNDRIAMRQQLSESIGELIKQKDEIEAQIKQVIGGTLGIKTGEYLVTWKEQTQSRVDVERLKADGLYQTYLKTSSTRVLRVRKAAEK